MEKKVRVCDECGKEITFDGATSYGDYIPPSGWLILRNIHLDYYDKNGKCIVEKNELKISEKKFDPDFCCLNCFLKWITKKSKDLIFENK